ncbi:MAG: single-stranded DNA-binding protein [Candidatus Magnetominusculus sp. LBB02]|nr:single-stranded DNA-binding protein [Candidatus Magnetominusculus sp. LBB02]
MYNKVIFMGNLTRDPELRYSPQGVAFATFAIAVNSKAKQGDEWKDEVLFMDITVLGKQAESCGEYLSKGSGVLVEGRLRERKWETDGQKKSKFDVLAQTVRFLPRRGEAAAKGGRGGDLPPDEVSDLEPF